MDSKINVWFLFLLIFLIFTTKFLYEGVYPVSDSRWSIHVAYSMISEGNINLDEYLPLLEKNNFYGIEKINGHYYSIFPTGVSILATPFVFGTKSLFRYLTNFKDGWSLERYQFGDFIKERIPVGIEQLIAAFYTTVTAIFLFIISKRYLKEKQALLITAIFCFGTAAWPIASRALWQHGPSMLMLSIILYLWQLSQEKPQLIQYIGLPLAFGYIIRPTNSIAIGMFGLLVLIKHRKYLLHFVFWILLVLIPFFLINNQIYGHILAPYYYPKRLFGNPQFYSALIGNFISPARGILIFSPILILSFYGIYLKICQKKFEWFDTTLVLIVLFHWISISSFNPWWGGHSYGYRLFSDMIPIFIWFIFPVFEYISNSQTNQKIKKTIWSAIVIMGICSCIIQGRGAISNATAEWNSKPNNIDQNSYRLWDWKDLQFLR